MKKIFFTLLIILSVFLFKSTVYARTVVNDAPANNCFVNLLVKSSGGSSQTNGTHSGSAKIFQFCDEVGVLKTFRIIHILINIAKILVPIMLIIIGVINYGKAAIGEDTEALEKTTQQLIKKVIVGLFIFLIPTIVNVVLSLGMSDKDKKEITSGGDFKKCLVCLTGDDYCDSLINGSSSSSISSGKNQGTWEDNMNGSNNGSSKPENNQGTWQDNMNGSNNGSSKPENNQGTWEDNMNGSNNGSSKPENNINGSNNGSSKPENNMNSSNNGSSKPENRTNGSNNGNGYSKPENRTNGSNNGNGYSKPSSDTDSNGRKN